MKMRMEKMDLEGKLDKVKNSGTEKLESLHMKQLMEKEELEMTWKLKLQDLDEYYKGYVLTKQAEHISKMRRQKEDNEK